MPEKDTKPNNAPVDEQVLDQINGESNKNDKDDPSIDLQDLALALNLINVAIKRGAYEPNELATVGQTHTKLDEFLKHQAWLQQQTANAKAQTASAQGEK